MAQRKKATPVVDAAAIEAEIREELAREGAIKLSRVKPALLRADIAATLSQEGFELTKAVIRRPLRGQLLEALEHGALVPVKSLAAHVRGATGPELKRLTDDAVREGVVRRVLRGTAEVLAGADVRVLSGAEAEAARLRVVGLGKALEKVTKKPGLSLLASDATAALSEAMTAIAERGDARTAATTAQASATERKPAEEAMRALLAAVDSTRDVRTGLSFVPAVVGRLAPQLEASAALKLLLTAAERELLELRPEGGIGRLSEAELSVCPAGPHGTRLSWARRLTGGAP
jgi:hypothetical protein